MTKQPPWKRFSQKRSGIHKRLTAWGWGVSLGAQFFLEARGECELPWKLRCKASACNAGDLGLIPGSGRSLGEVNGYPFQYSCLENPMDRGAHLRSMGSQRIRDDWMTNTLRTAHSYYCTISMHVVRYFLSFFASFSSLLLFWEELASIKPHSWLLQIS